MTDQQLRLLDKAYNVVQDCLFTACKCDFCYEIMTIRVIRILLCKC